MTNKDKAKVLLSGAHEKHIKFKNNKYVLTDCLFGNKSFYNSKEEAIESFLESEYIRSIMILETETIKGFKWV